MENSSGPALNQSTNGPAAVPPAGASGASLANQDRLYAMMEAEGFNLLIATTPENVYYTSGFLSLAHWVIDSQTFVVIPRRGLGAPVIIFPMMDIDVFAEADSWIKDFRCYQTFYIQEGEGVPGGIELRVRELLQRTTGAGDVVESLLEVVGSLGLGRGRVAIEGKHLPWDLGEKIRAALPEAELVEARPYLRRVRMIKTPLEAGFLQASNHAIEEGLRAAMNLIRPGVTEVELDRAMNTRVAALGAVPAFAVVTGGTRSSLVHANPSDYALQRGDIVRFDCGCRYRGYYSDTARTVVVGEAAPKTRRCYEALRRGHARALELVRPGTPVAEIFNAAVEEVRKAGIPHYRRLHTGHAIGVQLYDEPVITPGSEVVLEEGMVLNIEVPYYELGFGGMNVEDTLVVTAGGYRMFSTLDRELLVL
ncbi:MAG: aminopeptidase P family protein [Firmicutes bacterium]|nr:aminopeptidase P family protein [Bacillota bacterium]